MVDIDDILQIGCAMAQDLQEYVDAAEAAGSTTATVTLDLIEQWDKLYNQLSTEGVNCG